MLSFSTRKNKRKHIFSLFVFITIFMASAGMIVLSAMGVFRENSGFAWLSSINKLEKNKPDTNTIAPISEEEAILLIGDAENKGDDVLNSGNIEEDLTIDRILKETLPVSDEYFEQTLFIGDSRMLGLHLSCQDIKATFYAAVGLSINQLNTKDFIKVDSETSYTVMEAIEKDGREYKRVYLMFGLNELGWSYPSVFIRSVADTIVQLRELCPEAEMCIMAVMPVSEEANVSIYKGNVANERIREYNAMLLELASDIGCWYLDTYNLFSDEQGSLPKDFAPDGIHLYSGKNRILMNFILSHAFAFG
ncbi:MAG: hypothetical protein IKT56_00130 [Clostridia bacterium]|nr:hypothetical protein [Clostridia bacterium]